jgi:hypothetical protein
MQLDAQGDKVKASIDAFNAETKRMDIMAKIKEYDMKIDMSHIDAFNKQVDGALKLKELRFGKDKGAQR